MPLDADKSRMRAGLLVATHQKGQEQRTPFAGGQRSGHRIEPVVHRAALPRQRFLQFGQQRIDEPLVVARRGRTALLDQVVAGNAEQRIHHHRAVEHRDRADIFVDAPRPGDHADALLVGGIHRHGAGVDVEHAADHGSSGLQARERGCLFGNPAADIRRKPQGRQCGGNRLQPEKSEQPRIVVPRMQVHQVRARIIRHLGESFARQAEPDVILALEHPADIAVVLRLVVPQPRQQGHGLTSQHPLATEGERLRRRAVLLPAPGVFHGAVVHRDDPRTHGFPVTPPEV